jgi:hypothetical protein
MQNLQQKNSVLTDWLINQLVIESDCSASPVTKSNIGNDSEDIFSHHPHSNPVP